ncbi:C-terminal binding protein [Desulforhopalus singaporensis]|uniref:D-3-phosphoglycerate dehydrogenase n=1 Tax=Desulforhopalus singaporensis TaxID=91360 RepID=A0A1H0VYI6_9BACT|nr:C-terminal binding protein [Desulforhopalus singaporensis]SDP83295.1 D-3-phosphoglycerate dehydrogenase [Desulforhopalus singaporensis]
MSGIIWIIDEEWSDYEIEEELIKINLPDYEIKYSQKSYEKDLEIFGKNADAIICQIDIDMPAEVIRSLENCKIISIYGTGYEKVDVKAANEKKIPVVNVPNFCTEEVSDHVMAFIYYFCKKVHSYTKSLFSERWGIDAVAVAEMPRRLQGAILFVVGFGNIGMAVARKAKCLGMEVVAYDPYVSKDSFGALGVRSVSWETGFKIADFVSIFTRLTPETKLLIGMEEFKMMKNNAVLINTSRGGIVNETELVNAIDKGIIAGAALDVLTTEPPDAQNEILKREKILVTPHVSYLTRESLIELREKTTNNIIMAIKGQKSIMSVNQR